MSNDSESRLGGATRNHVSFSASLREHDSAIQNDPKFKKYAQQVEKCLASFENMHEWPDFISFLKQLLRTLQSYTQFKEIPRKLVVSKRLSQCLIPALPSGVHQRALDVYSHILSVLGPEGIKRDLMLWSSGLFPFFEYASTSVKPTILGIFEKFYLPLQEELRPVMRSFILALLPGLEEEISEYFDRVLGLLDRLSGTVAPAYFIQNIWLIVLTSPASRLYCLAYLSRRLPRLDTVEDITPIVGRDVGLMVRAFAAALGDDNLLAQRGTLDLLLQALRADSKAFLHASEEDRSRLMRVATGVVLRRDLSLNRRLFAWLLGPDEQAARQTVYFRKFALDLLAGTLRQEMYHPSSDYSITRPFKIYVSLLDKWEIGSPLTEVLFYDALKSIKSLLNGNTDTKEDVLITANTLYEAVEPRAIWRHLFMLVRKEIIENEQQRECIDMLLFVLSTFHVSDEEVLKIHLPLVFCAVVEKLEDIAKHSPRRVISSTFRAAMEMLEVMSLHLVTSFMTNSLQLPGITFSGSFDDAACVFYGLSKEASANEETSEAPLGEIDIANGRRVSPVPFVATFENLADLSMTCVDQINGQGDATGAGKNAESVAGSVEANEIEGSFQALIGSVTLLSRLSDALNNLPHASTGPTILLSWNAERWIDRVIQTLDSAHCSFVTADKIISLAIRLQATSRLQPKPSVDNRSRLTLMMHSLMAYLTPASSLFHVRAVKLIWELEESTTQPHIESIIAKQLNASSAADGYTAFTAFGNFWRLSEDAQQPGMHFKVPMLIVLNALKSTDPALRRIGETWVRCNLRSYPRALDPILVELLDPVIRRAKRVSTIKGREITQLFYEKPFDQHRVVYILDILLQIMYFGGLNFSRTVVSTPITRSHCRILIDYVVQHGHPLSASTTYMTVIAESLLSFLQTESKHNLSTVMQRANIEIHSTAIDLLQCIVSRGDLDHTSVEKLEAAVITKLFALVHSSRLELQNKLLHLLHTVIPLSAALADKQRNKGQDTTPQLPTDSSSVDASPVLAQIDRAPSLTIHPLLIRLFLDGVSTKSNRPLLQHWLDFILMTVPQFQRILNPAISPLNECICNQIRYELQSIKRVLNSPGDSTLENRACTDDAEFVMLLNALERMVLLSFDESGATVPEEGLTPDRPTSDGTGLLSMVSNVFLADAANQAHSVALTARSPAFVSLREGVGVLYSTWSLTVQSPQPSHYAFETLSFIMNRAYSRCQKVFERLYRVHAFEVLEAVIEYWSMDQDASLPVNVAFDIVDFLTASAQNVVHMVCESVMCRISPGASERSKKKALNPELTDAILFMFLEEYLSKLENPLALQVWPRFVSLAKDIAANVKEYRMQVFPILRCLTVMALKITQTTVIEDRRIKRDIQETYGKLLDACVTMSGKSSEPALWPTKRVKDALTSDGRDTPISRVHSESDLREKYEASDPARKEMASGVTDPINGFFAFHVLPNLRRFLVESDKVLGACNNIVYYVITPAFKSRTARLADIDDIYVTIIEQMSKIPAAVKAWRNSVMEVFNDIRLFSATPTTALKWRMIFKALIDADKTAFNDLLGKIVSSSSTNIFVNKEYEMQLKAQNIRRLSLIIFASEKNHFLSHLPAIQEKLVDLFRGGNAPIVEAEVYLCIRVLLCRLSPHNLSSFWPVLLAELIRVFEQVMAEPPSDGSEGLQAFLSACKLVDLLLVLQTEEFQIHQWIFVTDTVDAIYRPEDWFPEAIIDQLAELVMNLPASDMNRPSAITLPDVTCTGGTRQPLLMSARQIDSVHDLAQFFTHLSIMTYEEVYASGGAVDWDAVERSLIEDMFDGRE